MRPTQTLSTAMMALALTVGGLAVPAGTAFAAPIGGEDATQPSESADTIDAAAPTRLTIHKLLGDPGSGTTTPLAGVDFTVQRITNVDLTTQAGWDTLSGLTATTIPTGNLGAATTLTTGDDGVATTSSLPVGAYLVTEVQKQGYSVAPPFIVTLPHGEAGTWNYTQDVYPKNQNVTPDKQVDDTNATIGQPLAYTINAPVPAGALTRLVVTDQLVTNLTPPAAGGVTVTASDAESGANPVALTADDYSVAVDGQTVTVTFTQTGLRKLQEARTSRPALQVHVAFDAVVNSLPANGRITNTASVAIPGGTVTTDTQQGPTATTFAPLTITKTGPTGTDAAALAGATFQLYLCQQVDGAWTLQGDALQVATTATGAPAATLTTVAGDDGAANTAQGYGVPVNSFSGGSTGTVGNTYCVLETKAPTGFVRNPQPQPVTYSAGTPGTFTVSVANQKDTIVGQLPATGAWGLLAAMLAGGGLVLRGVVASRRDRSEQTA